MSFRDYRWNRLKKNLILVIKMKLIILVIFGLFSVLNARPLQSPFDEKIAFPMPKFGKISLLLNHEKYILALNLLNAFTGNVENHMLGNERNFFRDQLQKIQSMVKEILDSPVSTSQCLKLTKLK